MMTFPLERNIFDRDVKQQSTWSYRERWLALVFTRLACRERWLALVFTSLFCPERWLAMVFTSLASTESWLAVVRLFSWKVIGHGVVVWGELLDRILSWNVIGHGLVVWGNLLAIWSCRETITLCLSALPVVRDDWLLIFTNCVCRERWLAVIKRNV